MKSLEALFRDSVHHKGGLAFEPIEAFQNASRDEFLERWDGTGRRIARATIAIDANGLRRKQSYLIGIVTQNGQPKIWLDGGGGKIGADTDLELSAEVLQRERIPLKFAGTLNDRDAVEEHAQELLESWGVKLARAASGAVHVPCTAENTAILLLATALAKRLAKERAAGADTTEECTYTLFSTRHQAHRVNPLKIERLLEDVSKARRLRLASAFYDVHTLGNLLGPVPTSQLISAQIILNGTGGRRLTEQVKELRDFCKRYNKSRDFVELRLATEPGLFHSKLILLDSGRRKVAYVGSANATNSAFELNEELLVRIDQGIGPLESYFDTLWGTLKPMENLLRDRTASSLIAFFRTGNIYFKPSNPLQLTYSPFNELLRELPPKERAKLQKVSAPYSDPGEGIGPFNLKRALNMKDGDKDSEPRVTARIKPYAIETSLGYWVPSALDEAFEERNSKASERRTRQLDHVLEAIQHQGSERLIERYQNYLDKVRSDLDQNNVAYEAVLKRLSSSPFKSNTAFTNFLTRTIERLSDTSFKHRCARPYVRAAMPEIWSDPIAFTEFKNSFFEYIEFVEQRPGKKKPHVPARILERCRGIENESLEKRLVSLLRNKGWKDTDWKKTSPKPRTHQS